MELLIGTLIGMVIGYAFRRGQVGRTAEAPENSGEAAVRRTLIRAFNDPAYHLLNNITIPVDDGTTQIDHNLLSRHGIFVIETKHYSGWIFANPRAATWTQVKFRRKSRFQNPIRQNYKHLQVIKSILHFIPPEHIHSLVVFTGDATFKTEIPQGVLLLAELGDHIRQHQQEIMVESSLQFCIGRIEFYRFYISGVTDAEHQAYLNRKFGDPLAETSAKPHG
jgi:hypothetical protein